MLILSRKPGESIVIDGRIIVRIVRLEGDLVKLGIEAPADVPVHRQEVYVEIQNSNQEAMIDPDAKPPRLAAPVLCLPNSHCKSASPASRVSKMMIPTTCK